MAKEEKGEAQDGPGGGQKARRQAPQGRAGKPSIVVSDGKEVAHAIPRLKKFYREPSCRT